MADWLARRAMLDADHPALMTGRETLSYGALDARARGAAARMASLGVRAGDRVALLAGNRPETVIAIHAMAKLGAVLVPLNNRLTRDEIDWQLNHCGARLLLHDAEQADTAERAASGCAGVTCAALNAKITGLPGAPDAGIDARVPPDLSPDTLQAIIYTSGTTGRPKGAMLTYGNHFANAKGFAERLGAYRDDRWLLCMPLCHVGGLAILMRAVLFGFTVILEARFEEARILDAIAARRVTLLSVVPVMLQRLFDADAVAAADLSSLRCVLLGGGPARRDLIEESLRRKLPVATTYGLTECASQVATLPPGDLASQGESVGRAIAGVELRIAAADGTPAAPGEAGEICVRGPVVSKGYWRLPDAGKSPRSGGWFHTGDVGRLDSGGMLTVLDRRDDLVISGGENVYPAEVERALADHPDVLEAAVAGRFDKKWGAVVVGMVVRRPGARADEEALITHCRDRLAAYKAPRAIRFVERLPRNSLGKVLRREVTRQFEIKD